MHLKDIKYWLGFGTESETPRTGLLSSWKEWHSLWLGYTASVKHLPMRPVYPDSVEEPHVYRLGYLLGDLAVLAGIALVFMAGRATAFPADAVPDGDEWLPHHYLWGVGLVLLASLLALQIRRRGENRRLVKPAVVPALAVTGWGGWHYLWPHEIYAELGAGVVLAVSAAALTISVLGHSRRLYELGVGNSVDGGRIGWLVWDDALLHESWLAVVGSGAMLDDAIEHAYDVSTPLDQAYQDLLASDPALAAVITSLAASYLAVSIAVEHVYGRDVAPW